MVTARPIAAVVHLPFYRGKTAGALISPPTTMIMYRLQIVTMAAPGSRMIRVVVRRKGYTPMFRSAALRGPRARRQHQVPTRSVHSIFFIQYIHPIDIHPHSLNWLVWFTNYVKSSTSDETSTSTSHSSVVETHGGQVTTVTVGDAGSTSAADTANDSKSDDGGSGVSGGAIAGIVVGVVGGIALIVAAIILFLVKRRRAQQDAGYQNDSIDGRQSKGSGMSYAGSKGVFADNHSHTLSNGSSSAPHRMPTFTDNRLNTGALLYPNGRRASDVSLQDNEDYSRPVLRVSRSVIVDLRMH